MNKCNLCNYQDCLAAGWRTATDEELARIWKCLGGSPYGVTVVDQGGTFRTWFMDVPEKCCCDSS